LVHDDRVLGVAPGGGVRRQRLQFVLGDRLEQRNAFEIVRHGYRVSRCACGARARRRLVTMAGATRSAAHTVPGSLERSIPPSRGWRTRIPAAASRGALVSGHLRTPLRAPAAQAGHPLGRGNDSTSYSVTVRGG